MLEVFNNLFMSIAEQMGVDAAEHRLFGQHQGAAGLLLRDLRCGRRLVANAPHMPVHLGSMDRVASKR
jgi:5-oxoprolinase (ATP-hydrolysing)